MRQFRPRKVNPKSWRDWLKESLQLTSQKLILNVAIVLFILGVVSMMPDTISTLVIPYVSPLLLGIFAVVAYSTDNAKSASSELKKSVQGLLRIFFSAMLLVGAMHLFAFIVTLGGLFSNGVRIPSFQPPHASEFPMGISALGALFFWLLIPLTWFFVPLMACGRFSVRVGIEQAFDAFAENGFVWRVSAFFAVAAMIAGIWHGAAAVPMYPILGAMMYVAYRHIFLGVPPMKAEANAAIGIAANTKAS